MPVRPRSTSIGRDRLDSPQPGCAAWAPQTLDDPLLEAVTQFFREGQERGEARSDLMLSELTAIFLTSLFGVLLGNKEGMGPALRAPLKRVIDVFVRGVAP